MTEPTPDLFGHTPAQSDLFANEAPRNAGVGRADPERVRLRLLAMLQEARAATVKSPWDARTTRVNQILFPQMANWLPAEEADQLRLEFFKELKRLDIAA